MKIGDCAPMTSCTVIYGDDGGDTLTVDIKRPKVSVLSSCFLVPKRKTDQHR
jgi:hypothetical protein